MGSFWAVELLPDALRMAPGATALALTLLLGAALLTWLCPDPPSRRWGAVAFSAVSIAWFSLSWILRDRMYLLGDAQLWLHSADALGLSTPGQRAPLAVLAQMSITAVTSGWWSTATVLATVSCLCGAVTLTALRGYARQPSTPVPVSRTRPTRHAILLYGAPLSVIFFGHIETYPLFAAGLAVALPLLRTDLLRGRPGVRTAGALVLVAGLHVTGLLLVPPLVLAYTMGARQSVWRALLLNLALFFAGGIAAGLIPGLSNETTLAHPWTTEALGGYARELLNGWVLLLLPFALLLRQSGRGLVRTPMARFLTLGALNFMLLPLIGLFKLGLYRDLDLLSPAFILLVFLVVECDAHETRRPAAGLAFYVATGIPLLAALLTLNRAPEGIGYYQKRLEASPLDAAYRVYGYETLARTQRQRHDLAGARESVRRAISLVPTNTRLYGVLGEIELARGDTSSALHELSRALGSNRDSDVRALMAGLELRQGDARAAITRLGQGSTDVAASASASAIVATAYFNLGRPDSAEWACSRRLAAAPGDARAWANRASARLALRRPTDALADLESAVRLDPDASDIRRQRDHLRDALRR